MYCCLPCCTTACFIQQTGIVVFRHSVFLIFVLYLSIDDFLTKRLNGKRLLAIALSVKT